MVRAAFRNGRVAGYVIDALSADIDGAAVAHAFELAFCRSALKLPCALQTLV